MPHDHHDDAAAFWDAVYAEHDHRWSGEPNQALVREVADLPAGTALDVGCGEGGDAVWLAARGWHVLGVDVSAVALARATARAAAAGVADRVRFAQHDLATSFPAGTYDLVSAHYVHSHGSLDTIDVVAPAARAVAPGGTLLVVTHTGWPAWADPDPTFHFPSPEELLAEVPDLDAAWDVQVVETFERRQDAPDGTPTTRTDLTVRLRRRD